MFEKVNPAHPDKIADRIAGAIVDLAYGMAENPKIAAEVLIGHGVCNAIIETDADLNREDIGRAIHRISGVMTSNIVIVPQDKHLAENQSERMRCGDNGIFCGCPVTAEQIYLRKMAEKIYDHYGTDGKYIINDEKRIICQSNSDAWLKYEYKGNTTVINPLGDWTGGIDVDTGATNRKLGSDMGDAVTGGGLHGKDLSKADVSINIYAHLMAQAKGIPVRFSCAIGDEKIDGVPYEDIVYIARCYINRIGGFEKFAEWGLI